MIPTLLPVPIRKEVTIAAPPERVWPLVSTAEGLRRWWGATIDLEAKAGGRCEERGLLNGRPYTLHGIVSTWEPPKHLVLSMQRVELEGRNKGLAPIDSTIAIELRPLGTDNASTRVIVTHHLHDPALDPAVSDFAAGQLLPHSEPGVGPRMGLPHADRSQTATRVVAANRNAPWFQAWAEEWQRRTEALHELFPNDH